MAHILVSGLINLETTLRIERFPLDYFPVTYPFFGVRSTVSGVGYNIARALTALGDTTALVSLTGRLFSAFLHFYMKGRDPYAALQRAVIFAGYKIGATGAAEGFLDGGGRGAAIWAAGLERRQDDGPGAGLRRKSAADRTRPRVLTLPADSGVSTPGSSLRPGSSSR